tara:strand:- start:2296 stop:3594 length:1299 start_codon:yes stop_codon:yes gene_type:complete
MQSLKSFQYFLFFIPLALVVLTQCSGAQEEKIKPRILISSDIGGTDPDDNQSMIHLLMYGDLFEIEGLVSSPYGPGRKSEILKMIDLYEKDLPQLKKHAPNFPNPDALRSVCKQGAIQEAPYIGYDKATEGSEWIIQCAKKESDQPLWVLVWGGLEDLAQALHDAPNIKEHIKVYWIGGPNKKWSVNTYAYIVENHPDLWMIEANATYRGWIIDDDAPEDIKGDRYYENYIQGRGALGKDFLNYYEGNIKMGDTPSLAYVMDGDPNNPQGESWGGSFMPINYSSRSVFNRNTTVKDTVATYGVIAWNFEGPKLDIPVASKCFTMEISNQTWQGYYLGDGNYGVRYASKKPEICTYVTSSDIPELNGLQGQFVSINPFPGKQKSTDYKLGGNWYGDNTNVDLFLGEQQGAKTVSKHRSEFFMDWAKRWEWLEK